MQHRAFAVPHSAEYTRTLARRIRRQSSNQVATLNCPLCSSPHTVPSVRIPHDRVAHVCATCALIFIDSVHYLAPAAEKAYYGTHENSADNAGYVRFLEQLLQPMRAYLSPAMRGLDYGCGPGPTLSRLVRREGIACDDYDPFFADHALDPPYDFVLATECFEHFHHPARELARIHALLRPGGLLGIMTERWRTIDGLAGWHYTRDPTHVCFYHAATFDFICRHAGFSMLWMDSRRVVILRKDGDPEEGSP